MNIAAANALLKTLEEPLGKTIIVLLSDRPTMLPATIRSRCQLLAFGVPDVLEMQKWLQSASKTTLDVNLALNFTQGSPLRASALLEDQQMQTYEKLRQEIIEVMQKKMHAINFAAEHTDNDMHLITAIFCGLITDIIKLHFNPVEKFLINQDKIKELQILSKIISLNNIFTFWDELLQLNKMHYEHINFNKQLLLESLCLKCTNALCAA
jgi:DNA polymerase-3 subunit delta'